MTRQPIEDQLAPAPAAVRRAMLEARGTLEPGAAAVTGRFFAAVRALGGDPALPPAEAYRAAARSEATFRCLLRALARHAPHVCTAEAQPVSREWYARRPGATRAQAGGSAKAETRRTWPESWRAWDGALEAAPVKESTRARYRASVDRCAQLVAEGYGSEAPGFVTAAALAEGFTDHPDSARRVRPITAANYLDGFAALARFGAAPAASVAAMALVTADLRDRAALTGKTKEARLDALMERGGFAHVADRIAQLRDIAAQSPAHASAGRRALRKAVCCAVIVNKPPRKGDAVRWRLGTDLVRDLDGTWRATWTQEKTGHRAETGRLWPEVCALLDAWLLGGRPDRLVHRRYTELKGANWLTLAMGQPRRNLPTELTLSAIGVPSHDLRTLAADYLRRHDPTTAADIVATHLGHATRKAGEAYRALAEGEAACRIWQDARSKLGASHGTRSRRRSRAV